MPIFPFEVPHFFGLERLCHNIRGYHLCDPDETHDREELDGLLSRGQLTAFGRLLLGMLHLRAGRFAEADAVLEPAQSDERNGLAALALRSAALSRAGRHEEALGLLRPSSGAEGEDALLEAPPENDEVDRQLFVAFRVNALWLAGHQEQAIRLLNRLLELPDASDYRRQEQAQYAAALGDWRGTLDAIAKLPEHELWSETLYIQAMAHQGLGDAGAALAALTTLTAHDRGWLTRVAADPRFEGLPGIGAVRARLKPDLTWLKKRKDIAHLLDSAALSAAGLRWTDEETGKRETAEACGKFKRKTYSRGLLWNPEWWKTNGDIAKGKVMVAELPAAHSRSLTEVRGALFHDKKEPGHLFLTPNPDIPPAFWIRVPATEPALLDALGHFYPIRHRPRTALTRRVRAWAGNMNRIGVPNPYSGELEPAGQHEIERHWVSSPTIDMLGWGSAYTEDPWPNVVHMVGGLSITAAMRRFGQDAEGALPSMTHRTLFSRSHITMEIHPGGDYVWDIRYQPSPFSEPIARFNAQFELNLPLDLPIDVAPTLFGFQFVPLDSAIGRIEDPEVGDQIYPLINVAAMIGYGDLRFAELLRRLCAHPDVDVVATALNAAIRYNLPFVLCEAATRALPEGFYPVLAERIDQGIGAPPVSTEPDYGEEDEEEEEE